MSLQSLVEKHNPRKKDGHCPRCGAEGEDPERLEFRCPRPLEECSVLYWFE